MQYCPKCGGEIRGSVNFCPYCGAVQTNQNMPSMHYSYQARQPQIMPTTEQRNLNEVQQNIKPVQYNTDNNVNTSTNTNSNNKLGLGYLLALIFSLTFQPVGFIMSLVGYFTAKKSGNHTNKTLAKAGIIVSILEFIALIILCIFFFKVFTELMEHYPQNAY